MDESKTYDADLSAFTPDPHNANAGTERGVYMVEESLQRNGAARSIVVSVDNVVLAGNKTIEAAASVGIQKARVVEVDGDTLVVVKRTDVQAGTPKALDIAISDNRASEVGLDWDAEALEWAQEQGADLGAWWLDWELEQMKLPPESEEEYAEQWRGMPEFEQEDMDAAHVLKVKFISDEEYRHFAEVIGQKLTDNTRSIWFPERVDRPHTRKEYIADS